MSTKKFASQADLEKKKISFTKLTESAYAYTAEGDPNTGIVIGDDSVMVIDTQATPVMAQDVIRHIREVTDKPIKYVTLSHYHAVRVLGASAYNPQQIIASQDTWDLIVQRGEQDKVSEIGRFPRLFQAVDTVVWLPTERVLFSGDLVEFDATPYAGDAYFQDWPNTLDNIAALHPQKLVPGRGAALTSAEEVAAGLEGTKAFVSELFASVRVGSSQGKSLRQVYEETFKLLQPKYGHWVIFNHCMPFDVTRAFDEATQFPDPRIWTAERDIEMWKTLEG
jgi:glyoxylase-like metal-dependent hydrolase (beta-lactamase superfamily II)